MPLPSLPGLLILDTLGKPIIQTTFRAHPPAWVLLCLAAFSESVLPSSTVRGNGSSRAEELGEGGVVYVPGAGSVEGGGGGGAAVGWVKRADLYFVVPVDEDVDPLLIFSFLHTFISVLSDYLTSLSAASVRDNFDIVYQLLEEMLDSGHPLTTEPNALRDIVLPPSLLHKILSAAGASALSAASSSALPFASPIPWRRPGARYTNNEVYFDIAEELEAIVSRNGAVLSSEIWGEVTCQCRLTGTPDLSLTFTHPRLIDDPSFHPCIRYQKWNRDHTLSFVPPDGNFTLLSYRVPPPTLAPHAVPILLRATVHHSHNSASFDLTLTSRSAGRPLSDVLLEWRLGTGVTGVQATLSSGSGQGTGLPPDTKSASWGFSPISKSLQWTIPILPPGGTVSLKGAFSTGNEQPRPAPAVQIGYVLPQGTISGLKVESLKLGGVGEGYKPFKGVRGGGKGKVEWRI